MTAAPTVLARLGYVPNWASIAIGLGFGELIDIAAPLLAMV